MKTPVRLRGYVLDAHILQMKTYEKNQVPSIEKIQSDIRKYGDYQSTYSRFEVTLMPENIADLDAINRSLEEQRSRVKFQFWQDNNQVNFQTIRPPRVIGELTDLQSDNDFKGKFVQVVGHVQEAERDKDPFISFHIIEPAYQPLNGFEPMEELEDPLGDPYADMRRELKDHDAERDADMKKFFHNSQSSNNENKQAATDS